MNEVIVDGVPAYAGCINHPVHRENVRQRVRDGAAAGCKWLHVDCANGLMGILGTGLRGGEKKVLESLKSKGHSVQWIDPESVLRGIEPLVRIAEGKRIWIFNFLSLIC